MRAPRNILLLMAFCWLYLFAVGPTAEDRNPQLSPGITSATPNKMAAAAKPQPRISTHKEQCEFQSQPPPTPPIEQPPSDSEGLHSATRALDTLQHAAEQGQLAAQWKLGRMYADGDGVLRDDLRAFNYFNQIATSHPDEVGTPEARFVANAFVALGCYYLTGIPNSKITTDPARARDMFGHAAIYFGDADAQYELGRLYLTGTPGDPHQAPRWLQLAATKGHCRAEAALGDMLFEGQAVPRQAARGLMWLMLGLDCAGPDDTWVKSLYDSAIRRASDDERALALVYLEDWLKGRRRTPNTMAAPTKPAPPVSTQPPPVSIQLPPAQPHHLSSCDDNFANSDLAALNTVLQAVVAERMHAQEVWEQANNSKEIDLPQIFEDSAKKALRTQLAALMAYYQSKLSTFNFAYPDMLRLIKAQLNQIDQEIKSEADVIKQSLKARYESALKQEALLKKKMDEVKHGVLDTPINEIQYKILQREADTNRTLYEGLLQQYKDMGVAGAVGTNNVAVVDRAQVPDGPYKPNLTYWRKRVVCSSDRSCLVPLRRRRFD